MTRRSAIVHVPASTSNLGGGFDCVGMAVDKLLTARVTRDPKRPGISMARSGTLATLPCSARDDLLFQGFVAACQRVGAVVPEHLAFDVHSDIPVARGLGSSAAALVAGAGLADAVLDLGLGVHGVATLVSQIEGHPDNASPAAYGGAMLGVANNDGGGDGHRCTYAFSSLPVHRSLAFAFVIPSLEVTTASARAVLPQAVHFSDAVMAVQRSAALIRGLETGDPALLMRALDDVLHVPYRRHLIPGYDAVVNAACNAGAFGATLSGSGSAMVAISAVDEADAVASAMQRAFATAGLGSETLATSGIVPGMRFEPLA